MTTVEVDQSKEVMDWPEGLDVDEDLEHLHILDWGPSGSGKSITLATMPGPVGIIDCDQGTLSIKNAGMHKEIAWVGELWDQRRIIAKSAPLPKNDLEPGYEKLMEAFEYMGKLAQARRIRTLGMDSLTTMKEIVTRKIVLETKGSSRATKSFADWESAKMVLSELIQQAFTWPCHVFITAHEDMRADQLSGAVYTLPMVIGDMRHTLPIHFDESWHSGSTRNEKGQVEFFVETASMNGVKGAKSRLGLNVVISNNFRDIMEFYRKEGGKLYDKIMAEY